MSYRIEYMTETAQEDSVCHTLLAHSSKLDGAAAEAFEKADVAKDLFGATVFQIRHMNAVDKIVVIANFDDETEH